MSYSNRFQDPKVAKDYENKNYNDDGYDAFIWQLQKPFLKKIIAHYIPSDSRKKYLDFACGTGRIIGEIHGLFDDSQGLDISREMVGIAQRKYPHCHFCVGDVQKDPKLLNNNYDLITTFRFVLNAEQQLRESVLPILSSHLRSEHSVLIFNVHGHRRSLRTLSKFFHSDHVLFNELSMKDILILAKLSNLKILEVIGFGIFPRKFFSSPLKPIFVWLEEKLSGTWIANHFGSDLMFLCHPENSNT